MKISTYTFNKYLTETYIDDFEGTFGRAFKEKDITFLTFDKWKVFYEADPDNWKFHHDTYAFHRSEHIYFPYYLYIEDGGNKYRLIKFPTKREYKKFYRFYRKNIEHNLDGRENQQEILELSQIIGESAKNRVLKLNTELNEAWKNTVTISLDASKNNKGLSEKFEEYLKTPLTLLPSNSEVIGVPTKNEEYVFNKTPYMVVLAKGTHVYANISDDESPLFIEKLDSIGYPYTLSGIYTVVQEKFYKGYTYCKLDGFPKNPGGVWIRIADIKEKLK